ncbi:tail fiber assembly protein [Rahnella inusitata]|uniref:tail fiber assembly protein n=1 Tax=Rahnella inusitata TaxID=58169 RepID=UPI0039BE7D68
MINTYAVIQEGVVINSILLDDSLYNEDPETIDFGGELVLVTDNASIGWSYDGEKFISPPVPAPTDAEIKHQTLIHQEDLLAEANSITVDWRTELALGIITDEDKVTLIEWMNYIKAVKAVDISTARSVVWPEKPTA